MVFLEEFDIEKLQQHRLLLQEFNRRKLDKINFLYDGFIEKKKMTQLEIDALIEFKEYIIKYL